MSRKHLYSTGRHVSASASRSPSAASPRPRATTTRRAQGRRAAKKPRPTSAPSTQKALAELLGAFKFGMSKDQVLGVLAKQINEKYAEKIRRTDDIYTQDKLRKAKKEELARIMKSYLEFKGQKTGWDVSIIDDQFARNTDESMLVYWENTGGRNQRRFFFFFEGRLYKMFIALDSKQIADDQRNFKVFSSSMEGRFGPGLVDPTGELWKTPSLEVKAINKLRFYDAFCLVITDPHRASAVASMRKEHAPPPQAAGRDHEDGHREEPERQAEPRRELGRGRPDHQRRRQEEVGRARPAPAARAGRRRRRPRPGPSGRGRAPLANRDPGMGG